MHVAHARVPLDSTIKDHMKWTFFFNIQVIFKTWQNKGQTTP